MDAVSQCVAACSRAVLGASKSDAPQDRERDLVIADAMPDLKALFQGQEVGNERAANYLKIDR
eukprot:10734779-Alexandrium_andersonii.AAC.1